MGWMDFLEDLSGGVSGFVKGIDAGMAPLKTWEGIRTSDLQNDAREISNRDLELLQLARESPDYDYYGNKIGAEDTGFRQKMAAGERDIFGNEQALGLAQYLSNPDGAFQLAVRGRGLTPDMPEYRMLLQEHLASFDPMAAITADKNLNIPGLRQQNLNEQAALAYLQEYVRAKGPDPNAEVVRLPNGGVAVFSGGEMHPMGGEGAVQLASMLGAKTPYDALAAGVTNEQKVQLTNAQILKLLNEGNISPSVAYKGLQEEGTRLNQAYVGLRKELEAAEKTKLDPMSPTAAEDKAALDARVASLRTEMEQIKTQFARGLQLRNRLVQSQFGGGRFSGGGLPMEGGAPRPRTTAGEPGSSVTTRRPPPGALGASAGGRPMPQQLPLGYEEVDPYGAGSGYGEDVLPPELVDFPVARTPVGPAPRSPNLYTAQLLGALPTQAANPYLAQFLQWLNSQYGMPR